MSGFPTTPLEWLLATRRTLRNDAKLKAVMRRDCAPLPVGQALVVAALVFRLTGREKGAAVTSYEMTQVVGSKISTAALQALTGKGWLRRLGCSYGAGWTFNEERRAELEGIYARLEKVRRKVAAAEDVAAAERGAA